MKLKVESIIKTVEEDEDGKDKITKYKATLETPIGEEPKVKANFSSEDEFEFKKSDVLNITVESRQQELGN